MPRRHAITPARRDHMLANLRAGALYRDAAGAAGIPWSTWTDWCRDVRDGTCADEDVIELVTAARAAYAAANVGLTAVVVKAAQKDWRAAAFAISSGVSGFKVWRKTGDAVPAYGQAARDWSFQIAPTGVAFTIGVPRLLEDSTARLLETGIARRLDS